MCRCQRVLLVPLPFLSRSRVYYSYFWPTINGGWSFVGLGDSATSNSSWIPSSFYSSRSSSSITSSSWYMVVTCVSWPVSVSSTLVGIKLDFLGSNTSWSVDISPAACLDYIRFSVDGYKHVWAFPSSVICSVYQYQRTWWKLSQFSGCFNRLWSFRVTKTELYTSPFFLFRRGLHLFFNFFGPLDLLWWWALSYRYFDSP